LSDKAGLSVVSHGRRAGNGPPYTRRGEGALAAHPAQQLQHLAVKDLLLVAQPHADVAQHLVVALLVRGGDLHPELGRHVAFGLLDYLQRAPEPVCRVLAGEVAEALREVGRADEHLEGELGQWELEYAAS
jgi:hypothetical protein